MMMMMKKKMLIDFIHSQTLQYYTVCKPIYSVYHVQDTVCLTI